jgi:hypothetical protein
MRTYPGVKLIVWPAEQREQMKLIDDILRMLSAGTARSIFPGQTPAANPVPSGSNPTGPPPNSGTPAASEGDLLVGLANGAWSKLPVGGPGAILIVGGNTPSWLSTANQLGWTQEWRANGPYQVDTGVDGGILVPTNASLVMAWLYNGVDGSSGTSTVALKKNGSTIGTFSLTVGTPSASFAMSNSIVAGDLLTMDITVKQAGAPRDLSLIVKAN